MSGGSRGMGWVVRRKDGRAVRAEDCLFVSSQGKVKAFRKSDAMMMSDDDHSFLEDLGDSPKSPLGHPATIAWMFAQTAKRGKDMSFAVFKARERIR